MTVKVLLSARLEIEYEKGILSGSYALCVRVCEGVWDVSCTLLSVVCMLRMVCIPGSRESIFRGRGKFSREGT